MALNSSFGTFKQGLEYIANDALRERDVNVENKEPFLRIPLADKQPQSNIKGGSAAAIELPSMCI